MLFDTYFGDKCTLEGFMRRQNKTQPKSDVLTTEPIVHTDEISSMCCRGMSNTWDDTFGISSTSYQYGNFNISFQCQCLTEKTPFVD